MEGITTVVHLFVVSQNGSAFSRRQILRSLKTEATCLSICAGLAAAPLGQMRLARVFDHAYAMFVAYRKNLVQIASRTAQMNRHNRLRERADRGFNLFRVYLKC